MASDSSPQRQGPLAGLQVVFLGGVGPAPYGAMLLADLGAAVIRCERPSGATSDPAASVFGSGPDPFARGQSTVRLDLREAVDREAAWQLIDAADVLIEGFRPGVMERLGFAPEACHQRNPRLIYARVTGWGQSGPLARAPGHDINYIALTGALNRIGSAGAAPTIPLNLIGDFAGGGLWMAFGVMSALYERQRSGLGQVLDAAMIDGTLSLMTMAYALSHAESLAGERGTNLLDGGAHLYNTYACADGKHVAVGALEGNLYQELCHRTGLEDSAPEQRLERGRWAGLQEQLAQRFEREPQDHWVDAAGAAACITPVLDLAEAPHHPHHQVRASFMYHEGRVLPAPGPRFSRTPAALPPGAVGLDCAEGIGQAPNPNDAGA